MKEGTFVYKLFDKRDLFPFSVVRMPYIESSIPQNGFYASVKGDFLRIGCSTLCLRNFLPKSKELLKRMKKQTS